MHSFASLLTLAVIVVPGFALGLIFVTAASIPGGEPESATLIVVEAEAPAVSAASYYVFDLATGLPILTKDESTLRPIASVTKLFASAVYFNDAELGAVVTISEADVATEGESGRLTAGMELLSRELIFPALLESSNDAAAAQARTYPGDMLLAMHALANRADATNVSFGDTSGLSSENVASARSLSHLLTLVVNEHPHLFDVTRLPQYVHSQTTWLNNSPLAKLPGYRGGKHGYTHEAGRTAVAVFTDIIATGDTRQVGYVLLGSEDLVSDVSALRLAVAENVRFE